MDTNSSAPASGNGILAVLCGVMAVAVMDLSVVNVALPSIEAGLGVQPSSLQWVVVAYGIAVAGLLMLGGRLGDLFGHRRLLVVGLGVLSAASALGGFADSLALLVVARAGQGAGAACAVPNALALLSRTFAEVRERTRALGIFGAAGGTAAIGGSLVGGLLVEGPGWQWVFFVNVPLGVAIVVAALRIVPADTADRGPRSLDLAGAVTLTLGFSAFAFGVHQSVEHGWSSAATLVPLAVAAASLAGFAVAESRVAEPLVPLRTLGRPSLLWASVSSALMWASFLGLIYAATLFTQQVLGWSPLAAGSSTMPMAVVSIVANAILAPRIMARIGPAFTLAGGLVLMAAGLAWLLRVPTDASFLADLAPAYCVIGLGLGLAEVGSQVAAFTGVEGDEAGMAGGALETAREMGGALGLAVFTAAAAGAATGTDSLHRIVAGGALVALAGGIVAATLLRHTETDQPSPPEKSEPDVTGRPVVHFEIIGRNPDGLRRYFGALFGWEFDTPSPVAHEVSDADQYGFLDLVTGADGSGIRGGIGGGPGRRPHALFYVAVPDVEAALQRAEELGGTRTTGPVTSPNGLVVGHFRDPEGNLLGVAGTGPAASPAS